MNQELFNPFRVNTSDGKHYDITNPEFVVVTDNRLFIVRNEGEVSDVALRHVTSVDSLAAT